MFSDYAIPFSRLQAAITLFAYTWLLSNFVRTEFVLPDLDKYTTLEADVYMNFGLYTYTGNAFFRHRVKERGARDDEDAANFASFSSSKPVVLWGYKFGTTSIAMRAFAEHLGVAAFPPCVLYHGECDSDWLSPAVGMAMLDALVDAVRNTSTQGASKALFSAMVATQSPKLHSLRPTTRLVRVRYDYYDRIHHYLLPSSSRVRSGEPAGQCTTVQRCWRQRQNAQQAVYRSKTSRQLSLICARSPTTTSGRTFATSSGQTLASRVRLATVSAKRSDASPSTRLGDLLRCRPHIRMRLSTCWWLRASRTLRFSEVASRL